MASAFQKAEKGIEGLFGGDKHSHTHFGELCADLHPSTHTANRYDSFAPQSSGQVKWHVDGCSYFWAVSQALEQAKETIYILDWWLSPELYLRRPPAKNEQYRLDRMLKAAAERGVKIYVIVYKEVPAALTLNSEHTKHALEALHPNIKVFRHPDHYPSGYDIEAELMRSFHNLSLRTFDIAKASHDAVKALYGTSDEVVLYWAHHEKLCVIDSKLAFMGGLDLCFGRWDTNSHPIADVHPSELKDILFPGQDYNNARIYDFEDVEKWENNKLDRTKSSRMGWSDLSLSLTGPIVSSLVIHFTDRWNYIYSAKYAVSNDKKYHQLDPPASHDAPTPGLFRAGTTHVFEGIHRHFNLEMNRLMDRREEGVVPGADDSHVSGAHIQLTRSCSRWSSGHRTEHSIANAYIEAITNAQHFVYIENQFFITATDNKQHPVMNKIGAAIAQRIIRAHQDGEDFRVIVCMPSVPAFAGDLKSDGALGTRAIMEFQYNSISRGGYSILETVRNAGVPDPSQYIGFYNLRNFDRIHDSATLGEVEKASGVSYEAARKGYDDSMEAGVDGYRPYGDARLADQYRRYEDATKNIADTSWDTISACYMDSGPDLASIPWNGTPEAEMDAFVSEELYIHTKLLIADDRLVICGSANLNDRSQLGTHDSEIAVVIEDPTPVASAMAGRPYTASAFAASLRRQLFRKHLGLLPDQPWDRPDANWTPADRDPNAYDWGSPADTLVRDPLSHNFQNLWRATARANTDIFSRAFHNVPNDKVRTWKDYNDFFSVHFLPVVAKEPEKDKDKDKDKAKDLVAAAPESDETVAAKTASSGGGGGDERGFAAAAKPSVRKVNYGHIVPEEFPGGVDEVKQWLGGVRGTLVEMPLDFLCEVKDLAKEGLSLNSFTDELYT